MQLSVNSKSDPKIAVILLNKNYSFIDLPDKINELIKPALKKKFKNSFCQIVQITNYEDSPELLYLVGLGKHKLTPEKLRFIGSKIGNLIKDSSINLYTNNLTTETEIVHLLEGINHGTYKFNKYLSKKRTKKDFTINIVDKSKIQSTIQQKIDEFKFLYEAQNYVKDLVNSPAIDVTPTVLSNEAKSISSKSKYISYKEIDEKDFTKLGLNLIKAVGSGSGQNSKLIFLEYKFKPKNINPLLMVGKGVTFDAGGLNLKPSNNIETMKTDMAGAATVLGLFKILSSSSIPLHIVGVIPSVENLVGENAYKPGDIFTAHNGKTIEITNTDAEGRLILADAISYSLKKYSPESIIDLATLTGACIVALGFNRSGLFSNNKSLQSKLLHASKQSGDKVWPMPLDQFHRSKVAGSISDYKNWTSGVNAGAIMAAAFLEKFVNKTPWAHLDIAGPSYTDRDVPEVPKGASGVGVRTLLYYLYGWPGL